MKPLAEVQQSLFPWSQQAVEVNIQKEVGNMWRRQQNFAN